MSRFYVSGESEKCKEITRCGHRGVSSHPRGWNVGVRVEGHIDDRGQDAFDVYLTGGSRNKAGELLGTATLRNGERVFDCKMKRNNIACIARLRGHKDV